MQRAPAWPAERLFARQAEEFGELVLALDAGLHLFRLVLVTVPAFPLVRHHTVITIAAATTATIRGHLVLLGGRCQEILGAFYYFIALIFRPNKDERGTMHHEKQVGVMERTWGREGGRQEGREHYRFIQPPTAPTERELFGGQVYNSLKYFEN